MSALDSLKHTRHQSDASTDARLSTLMQLLDELSREEIQELLVQVEKSERSAAKGSQSDSSIVRVFKTFNLYPSTTADSYLTNAGVARSDAEGWSDDWKKLSGDFVRAVDSWELKNGRETA